jgi:cytochrome b subunit of formate dehydrogenase
LQDLAFQLEYQGKESEGIWGNQMENKEIFWEKEKSSPQKKPKSKKSAALIFILLICFSIFLCLFVHELVNKLGTTGMGACLTKTTKEKKKKKKRQTWCEDEEDKRGREKKIKE